jgi:acyl-CoA thioesterase I
LRSIRILLLTLICAGAAAAGSPRERTLLVFGDSLSAAYGLRAELGWTAQLQKRLQEQGYGYRVVNASVSGETTAGGKARLARALEAHRPNVVILQLGANDGLRGLPVKDARANLAGMIADIKQKQGNVLLAGVLLPPNYGTRYASEFAAMYTSLAKELHVPLVPFILAGAALDERYMQPDGLHPNAAGQPIVLENIWKHLKPLLER